MSVLKTPFSPGKVYRTSFDHSMISPTNPVDGRLLSMSVTNALRTGNVILDVLISTCLCMLLPILVEYAKVYANHLMAFVREQSNRRRAATFTRVIKTTRTLQYNEMITDKNSELQKALDIYIHNRTQTYWASRILLANYELVPTWQQGSTSRRLHRILTPADDCQVDLGNGILCTRTTSVYRSSHGTGIPEYTVEMRLSATGPDAAKRIDAFVDTAFQSYLDLVAAADKDTRFLLCMKAARDDATKIETPLAKMPAGGNMHREMRFARYCLSNDKTFESLFIPEKTRLLSMLDHFTSKTGKYAIPGFPHKLGFLLHGPPGTGKTSLIKAVAHRTQRHIVSIPLTRIKTNEMLMQLFYGGKYWCDDMDTAMHLPFHKLIFVLEDVDASSKIVQKRSTDLSQDDHRPPAPVDDALDLAGILNVLDGVADSPGRIVMMTTNHPDRLDPALTRPGRVTMSLHLTYMQEPEMRAMIQHFFGPDCLNTVNITFPSNCTAAMLEEMCIAADHVDALIEKIQAFGGQSLL